MTDNDSPYRCTPATDLAQVRLRERWRRRADGLVGIVTAIFPVTDDQRDEPVAVIRLRVYEKTKPVSYYFTHRAFLDHFESMQRPPGRPRS